MATTKTEKEVIKNYGNLASRYDSRYQKFLKITTDRIIKSIPKKSDQKILDIACGTGELLLKISDNFPDAQLLIGVDVSEAMLKKAEQKLKDRPHVELRQMSAEAIPYPYPNNFFDTIVSSGAMHYMNDFEAVLQEIKRILTVNGTCIIVDIANDFFSTRFINKIRLDPGATIFHSLESAGNLVKSNGLNIVSSQLFRAGIYGLYLIKFKK